MVIRGKPSGSHANAAIATMLNRTPVNTSSHFGKLCLFLTSSFEIDLFIDLSPLNLILFT